MKKSLLIGLSLCAGVVAMTVVIWRYADSGYYCADAVECTFQALEMKAAGTLFPKSWCATNFAHLQVLPLRLGFWLSPSFVTANRVCDLAMYALTLLSLIALWRKGLRDGSGALVAFVCALPVSGYVSQQLFTGVFYTQFVIGTFFMLTLWLVACTDRDCGKFVLLPIRICVALAVTFLICALMGSRMVAVIGLPIAGGIVWMSVFDAPPACGDRRRWLGGVVAAMAVGVACVAGNRVYETFVAPSFGVAANVSCVNDLLHFAGSGDRVFANLGAICEGVMRMLDFPFNREMTDVRSLFRTLGFAVSLCLYMLFPVLESYRYRRIDATSRFLLVVAWLSVAITAFILSFGCLAEGDEWNMCARYLLLPGTLLLVVGARYAYDRFFASCDVRRRLVAFGIVLALMASFYVRWFYAVPDQRASWRGVLECLRAERLSYGYASYENALLPTFYSEGRIMIPHVVVGEGRLSLPTWSTAERWYEAEGHDGQTFLMLTDDELSRYAPHGLEKTVLGKPTRVIPTGRFKILVYDYNIAVSFVR